MTTEAKDGGQTTSQDDPFIGRGYVCCKGPLKGDTILVVERISDGDDEGRYQLEAENDGHRWTIEPEKLARIFDDSAKRTCGCFPLDGQVVTAEAVEHSEATSHDSTPAEAAPHAESEAVTNEGHSAAADAEEPPTARDAPQETPAAEEREECSELRPAPTPQGAATSGVIFREESQQGALF